MSDDARLSPTKATCIPCNATQGVCITTLIYYDMMRAKRCTQSEGVIFLIFTFLQFCLSPYNLFILSKKFDLKMFLHNTFLDKMHPTKMNLSKLHIFFCLRRWCGFACIFCKAHSLHLSQSYVLRASSYPIEVAIRCTALMYSPLQSHRVASSYPLPHTP